MKKRRRITLAVRSPALQPLAELIWDAGTVQVRHHSETLRPAIDRWVKDGLSDGVGEPSQRVLQHTRADDPQFLIRLHDYLSRVSSFNLKLVARDFVSLGVALRVRVRKSVPNAQTDPMFQGLYSRLLAWTVQRLGASRIE